MLFTLGSCFVEDGRKFSKVFKKTRGVLTLLSYFAAKVNRTLQNATWYSTIVLTQKSLLLWSQNDSHRVRVDAPVVQLVPHF